MVTVMSTRGIPSASNAARTGAGGDARHALTHRASATAPDNRADKIVISVNRRLFLTAAGAGALGLTMRGREAFAADEPAAGSTLYNGIRIADPWPPCLRSLPDVPIIPPYLVDPPAVIPIDL